MSDNNSRSTAEAHHMRSFDNLKPYRSADLKAEARRTARKCEDGTWRSSTDVLYHPRVGQKPASTNTGG